MREYITIRKKIKLIRRNDTLKGDGNNQIKYLLIVFCCIRRNDTLKGDGNIQFYSFYCNDICIIRRNDTLKGDGNKYKKSSNC